MKNIYFKWIAFRLIFTIGAAFTINHIISALGYRTNLPAVFWISLILVITIRLWGSPPKENDEAE